jgi:hypothetical protein
LTPTSFIIRSAFTLKPAGRDEWVGSGATAAAINVTVAETGTPKYTVTITPQNTVIIVTGAEAGAVEATVAIKDTATATATATSIIKATATVTKTIVAAWLTSFEDVDA